jgi:hypothetical protein
MRHRGHVTVATSTIWFILTVLYSSHPRPAVQVGSLPHTQERDKGMAVEHYDKSMPRAYRKQQPMYSQRNPSSHPVLRPTRHYRSQLVPGIPAHSPPKFRHSMSVSGYIHTWDGTEFYNMPRTHLSLRQLRMTTNWRNRPDIISSPFDWQYNDNTGVELLLKQAAPLARLNS